MLVPISDHQAVYNDTKAFLDSLSFALRAELKDSGVTVTCLMPGATETDFFERDDMLETEQERLAPAGGAARCTLIHSHGRGLMAPITSRPGRQ